MRPAVESSSVNSDFTKIPKPLAKQGDVGAQEFGQDDPPHYLLIYTKLLPIWTKN